MAFVILDSPFKSSNVKQIFDVIGGAVTLFIMGVITIAALKAGYGLQAILIVGIIAFLLYRSILSEEKQANKRKEDLENEKREEFRTKISNVRHQMYSFAYENERISTVTYDIEEGGHYLTEYDENRKGRIDRIIDSIISYPSAILPRHISLIEEEILKLPKVKLKRKYIGFD